MSSWDQKLRELVDEAHDLGTGFSTQALRAAISEEIVWRWDRQLHADQTLLACLRVLRETNPRPNGGRRAA